MGSFSSIDSQTTLILELQTVTRQPTRNSYIDSTTLMFITSPAKKTSSPILFYENPICNLFIEHMQVLYARKILQR